MMAPKADRVAPTFGGLLLDEPLSVGGWLTVPDRPGFGVELNQVAALERPFKRDFRRV